MELTPRQIAFFGKNGYLPLPGALQAKHVQRLRAALDEICADLAGPRARRVKVQYEADIAAGAPERSASSIRRISRIAWTHKAFRDALRDSGLLDAVESLQGRPVRLYSDEAYFKSAFVGSELLPHQDSANFGIRPGHALLTLWIAIDDAHRRNGCMHYVPGSHRRGLLKYTTLRKKRARITRDVDLARAVAVPMRAGGAILHHGWVVHYSEKNESASGRRAYAGRFISWECGLLRRLSPAHSPLTLRA